MLISRSFGTKFARSNVFLGRFYANQTKLTETTKEGDLEYDEVPIFEKEDKSEEIINQMRNKSRLNPSDRNRLYDKKPYEESLVRYHDTVKYKRKILGKYGLKALDAIPGIAWPTLEDIDEKKEYERVAYPISIQEGWKLIEEKKQAIAEAARLRDEQIEENLKKMSVWRKELSQKIEKKEAAERAAREKKERMIEEVRREFGLNIDPKSFKFKELMKKKEELELKNKKKQRKEEKSAKFLEKLTKQYNIGEKSEEEMKPKKKDDSNEKKANKMES